MPIKRSHVLLGSVILMIVIYGELALEIAFALDSDGWGNSGHYREALLLYWYSQNSFCVLNLLVGVLRKRIAE